MQSFKAEICYGALFDALAKPVGNKSIQRHGRSAQVAGPFVSFGILEQTQGVFGLFSNQDQLAVLDVHSISKLKALRQISGMRYEAVVESRAITKRRAKDSAPFQVSINIFGPRDAAEEVSDALSRVDAYLQHPHALSPNVDYHNPDMLVFSDEQINMNHLIGISVSNLEHDQLSLDVQAIFGSLSDVTGADELGSLPGLASTLTKHQQEGVRFILQRENEDFSRQLSDHIRHVTVASDLGQESQSPSLGGIVADVMGLGKTLTALTAILHSSDKARDFSYFGPPTFEAKVGIALTKATLVIVPSVQLIENWEAEIITHFRKGSLEHIRFHGQSRPRTLEALRSHDIVITTYATLAADYDGQALLYDVEWYRIVLDEAHLIRNPTSKQFKAAVELCARRRWCLSGTPVQNRLEDLASLARFLHLTPISSKEAFEKNILIPLSEPQTNSKPLRAYMQAYCLRRSESCLSLPASREEHIPLYLSPAERKIYDQVLENARNQIDDMVSSGQNTRCTKLFTALLRMRMICNTGTFNSTGTGNFLTGRAFTSVQGIAVQDHCERCSATDGDTLLLLSTCDVCPDCMRPLRQPSPSPSPAAHPSPQTPNEVMAANMAQSELSGFAQGLDQQKFSTKLNAVLKNVVNTSSSTNKAIVFSYWKSTLKILGNLLENSDFGAKYVLINGETSFADRSSHLRSFREDPEVYVLLMTVETGAVGLNLTVATQVHIVEPQWNPSIEEQAIARALRMGQIHEVTIYRYVLQNTIEQNVLKLQEKKKMLAKFTLGGVSEHGISEVIQDLEAVLELKSRKRAMES